MDIDLIIFLLFVAAPLSILLHETGHAIAGFIFNAERINLIIGRGKRFITYSFGKLHFTLHVVYFMGGYAENERTAPFNRFEKFIISFFGPLMNIVIFILAWELQSHYTSEYLRLFAFFNLWLVIINLIPFTWKNKKSDGYNLLLTLIQKGN
ncbi:M50 family metallopeptidase [Oceanobacillus manasiensis]|uniref:M50 family metallopeptidase n=1 Tax=Oceanobacillus manasiensis TaxID=586413 RepID=UPI0005A74190|nr:M50 family metallopeptidase [Oceanobacillus manasiensis]